MSKFRNFMPRGTVVPQKIFLDKQTSIVDDDGVSRFVVVSSDVSSSKVPKPSEYELQTLLASGIPLNRVNPVVVDSVPSSSQLENAVSQVIENKDINNSNNTDTNE